MIMPETVVKKYNCKICKETHDVELNKGLLEGRERFPFPHVFLHGDLKQLLTILYLDKDLQIRGAEVQNLRIDDANLFSKDHTTSIVENLMNEIERLRLENEKLCKELDELKKK